MEWVVFCNFGMEVVMIVLCLVRLVMSCEKIVIFDDFYYG